MSNKLFQGIIYQMRDAVSQTIGVIDDKGTIVACSDLSKIGENHHDIVDEISYTFDTIIISILLHINNCHYEHGNIIITFELWY